MALTLECHRTNLIVRLLAQVVHSITFQAAAGGDGYLKDVALHMVGTIEVGHGT